MNKTKKTDSTPVSYTKRVPAARAVDAEDFEWGPDFDGWAVKFAAKNIWRLKGQMAIDDLVGECTVHFMKLVNSDYKIANRLHLMTLWKRKCEWGLISLSRRLLTREGIAKFQGLQVVAGEHVVPASWNSGKDEEFDVVGEASINVLLDDAPEEYRPILRAALSGEYVPVANRRTVSEWLEDILSQTPVPAVAQSV